MHNRFLKPIFLGLLLAQVANPPLVMGATANDVLIHNKAQDLTKQQVMDEFLLQTPEIQGKLKKNELNFRKFVDAVNNELLFAAEANKQHLQTDPEVAKKIAIAIRKTIITELIAKKTASIKVPNMEKLALAEYKAHPEKYMRDEAVNAKHILVTFNEKNKPEKLALLKSISQKVAAGESFADLAKKYSADKGSADKGGELGWFGRGKTVKPFEDAAFALKKPGQLSDVIETSFGLHLIQLVEYAPRQREKFDEVKAGLMESMRQDYIKHEIDTWRNSILDLKNATLNEAELEELIGGVKKLPD